MHKPVVSIIVAMDEKRGIGKENALMWRIPGELPRFKKITIGHPIIMGRKTFESIGKALPGRTNIVITRDKNFSAEGVIVSSSLPEAIEKAQHRDQEEVFIIGGGQIYSQALPLTDKLYLTLVKGDFGADTFFPDYSVFSTVVSKEDHKTEAHVFQFVELTR